MKQSPVTAKFQRFFLTEKWVHFWGICSKYPSSTWNRRVAQPELKLQTPTLFQLQAS